jgi:hypothetical protein
MPGAVLIGHALGFGVAAVLSVSRAGSGSSPAWVILWAVVGLVALLAGYGVLRAVEAARVAGMVFLVPMVSIYLLAAAYFALALRSPIEAGGVPLWFTTLSPSDSRHTPTRLVGARRSWHCLVHRRSRGVLEPSNRRPAGPKSTPRCSDDRRR